MSDEAGDPAPAPAARALGVLFDTHAPGLHRYLARRVGSHDAEDLVAETFLAATRSRFDPWRGSERAWLFGIATNLLRRHLRQEVRGYAAQARAPREVADPADEVAIARVHAAQRVARLACGLAALPADERDVLLLVAWGGLEPSEVAAALGVPAGTARSRLHRARRALRGPTGEDDDA
ncbi:RNA polymerase sigma factor [Pseudonocardia sichuanensis]